MESAGTSMVLAIVAGDGQTGAAGEELSGPLAVRATDSRGRPLRDQVVIFHVVDGGGSMFAGTGITNKDGLAQDYWTLGTAAGAPNTVEVRAVDPSSGAKLVFAVFQASAVPGRTAAVIVEPAGATVPIGTTLQMVTTLRDRFENIITDRAPQWVSGSPGVAEVSQGGLVSGVALGGPVTITALSDGAAGSSLITVTSEPDESLGEWTIVPAISVSCPIPLQTLDFTIEQIAIVIRSLQAHHDAIVFATKAPFLGTVSVPMPFAEDGSFSGQKDTTVLIKNATGDLMTTIRVAFDGSFTSSKSFSAHVSVDLKFTDVPLYGTVQCTNSTFSVTGTSQ